MEVLNNIDDERFTFDDYENYNEILYNGYLMINDNIDDCTEKVHEIIRTAHYTAEHEADTIDRLKKELDELIGGL